MNSSYFSFILLHLVSSLLGHSDVYFELPSSILFVDELYQRDHTAQSAGVGTVEYTD